MYFHLNQNEAIS
jgi:serine/threonine protein kinase